MARHLALAALATAMLCALPAAYAQEDMPELDGGPPPLQIPKPAPKPAPKVAPKPAPKPAPRVSAAEADKLKAEQARLARQAETQKAEQLRLDRQAAALKAEADRLAARAAAIADEEKRLAQLRTEQEADYTQKLAELERQRVTAPPVQSAALPEPEAAPVRPRAALPRLARINYEDARRACTRAGMSEAVDRDFYSARYESAPRLFERERELRGLMRMDDRRGYLLVDTVCELDDDGSVLHFEVLR